jgi:predicted MFS family arabinose efflux permease
MILSSPVRLRFQILFFTIARTIVNTGIRMVYPFLPAIARGLGVEIESVTLAITARSALGFIGPVLGSLADRLGRKMAMLSGLALYSAGLTLVAFWPTFAAFFLALVLSGIGKIVFDASVQAYVGDRVPRSKRGLAVGLIEFGWSGAFLIGIPAVGWVIARAGWSAPFPLLAALVLAAGVILWRIIPGGKPQADSRPPFFYSIRVILTRRVAFAALLAGALISASNEVINIVFGLWMEDAFGLQIAALGIASAVIGIAELGGEGLVVSLTDRLGMRRSVVFGIAANIFTSLALPLLGTSITGALLGLFVFYLTFEFTIVATIALMTELAPDVRATLMAGNIAFHGLGRVLGALIGPLAFASGMSANGLLAAIFNGIALVLLLLFVRE